MPEFSKVVVFGVGLIGGVELVKDTQTKAAFETKKGVGAKAVSFALQEGLITRAMGDRLAFCPPLIIDEKDVDEIGAKLEKALRETERAVREKSV